MVWDLKKFVGVDIVVLFTVYVGLRTALPVSKSNPPKLDSRVPLTS